MLMVTIYITRLILVLNDAKTVEELLLNKSYEFNRKSYRKMWFYMSPEFGEVSCALLWTSDGLVMLVYLCHLGCKEVDDEVKKCEPMREFSEYNGM